MNSLAKTALVAFGTLLVAPGCGEESDPLDIRAPVTVSISCTEKSLQIVDIACFPTPGRMPWAIRDATTKPNIYAFAVSIEAGNGSWSFNGWERQEFFATKVMPPIEITISALQGILDTDETTTLNWLCSNHSCCVQCCEYQDVRSWFDSYWMAADVSINSGAWRTDTLNLALEQEITFVYSP